MTSTTADTSAASSPLPPPRDVQAVNTNDVRRFVYHWFTLFEHRAPAERLVAHLTAAEPLSMTFPGAEPMHEVEQFTDWYEELLANTRWNFHELSHLTVAFGHDSTFEVAFDVDWEGAVTDESAWPTNLPEHRFRFELRQRWRVASHRGNALDNPFHLVHLVAESR